MQFGYTLASEEHGPEELVRLARRAEECGFAFGFISDHYHPWSSRQGHSPFVWSVLGAIARDTERLRLITGVTCPTLRVHPAIVAQAAATTARLFDGRFALGLGSGENLNEHITGEHWPEPGTRLAMLEEAIDVIRQLLGGEVVTHRGVHYTVEEARLFTLPETPPPLYIAASGASSVRLAARKGDGLIGLAPDHGLIARFKHEAGPRKPRIGQIHFCYGPSEEEARREAWAQWGNSALPGRLFTELKTTEQIDAALELVRESDLSDVVCGPDTDLYLEAIEQYREAGYDHLAIHQIGDNQEAFFDFWESVLSKRLGGSEPRS